jgi:hypothetical protein
LVQGNGLSKKTVLLADENRLLTSHQDSFFPCGCQALTKKNLAASLEKAAKNTKKIEKF